MWYCLYDLAWLQNVYCYKIKRKKINVVIVLSEKVVYSFGNVYIGYANSCHSNRFPSIWMFTFRWTGINIIHIATYNGRVFKYHASQNPSPFLSVFCGFSHHWRKRKGGLNIYLRDCSLALLKKIYTKNSGIEQAQFFIHSKKARIRCTNVSKINS